MAAAAQRAALPKRTAAQWPANLKMETINKWMDQRRRHSFNIFAYLNKLEAVWIEIERNARRFNIGHERWLRFFVFMVWRSFRTGWNCTENRQEGQKLSRVAPHCTENGLEMPKFGWRRTRNGPKTFKNDRKGAQIGWKWTQIYQNWPKWPKTEP